MRKNPTPGDRVATFVVEETRFGSFSAFGFDRHGRARGSVHAGTYDRVVAEAKRVWPKAKQKPARSNPRRSSCVDSWYARPNPAKLPADAFRKPDRTSGDSWVWYGPGGRRKAAEATEVVREGGGYYVSEYQHVEGYIENYDKDYPFLRITTFVEHAISPRVAARLGVDQIAEQGGEEEFVSELP